MATEREAKIKIEILGKDPSDGRVYARLRGKGERKGYVHYEMAWISSKKIIINKQDLGPRLTGMLRANVVESLEKVDLVEVETETDKTSLFLVNRSSHEIIPFPSSNTYRKGTLTRT